MNEESLFVAALDKQTPAERQAFLEEACGADVALRARVQMLLEADARARGILDRPVPGSPGRIGDCEQTGAYMPGEKPGAVIAGRYKLLESIGEGGMGSVWVAEQVQSVRRKVAVKLIKPGMDSKSVLARFEAERQALALMDHPNIARVLDGGFTDQGRPFFVMEYVKGVPLTRYCDDSRLTVSERLELFVPVCQAVQHAHQKGIVHRDLKPSNVLVCLYDGKPVPKVIDFGLAKAIHQPLTEHTLFTGHGVMMGTPLYMSPEQAELNNLDVDTRTDVYSLGVILYELLTGSTPLEKQRFQQAALQEMLRLIKEEEPPRPSTRLSGKSTSPTVAAQRRIEPVKLSRLLRGELDWIVMKALEKDRNRRYETANGFAADVGRYLAREAVMAVPPSAGYRLRKFLRRNRVAAAMTSVVVAAALLAAAGQTWNLWRARAAEAKAVAAEKQAVADRAAADAARQSAVATATSLQVDLDLAELRQDPRYGLLRLARTLRELRPDLRDLREFLAAAILAGGQDYAPLLPPITYEGQVAGRVSVSPDHRTLLTLGVDFTALLWDIRTARLIAVLRNENERVVNCGFSPDGSTVFTDDRESVARFWDVPSGRYRAAIEPRQSRYVLSDEQLSTGQKAAQIHGSRLLTTRCVVTDFGTRHLEGPVELWDTATGRPVAALDGPDRDISRFQFLGDGRWVSTLEGKSTVLVFSANDGRLLGRLAHEPAQVREVFADPTGQRVATATSVSIAVSKGASFAGQGEPATGPQNADR